MRTYLGTRGDAGWTRCSRSDCRASHETHRLNGDWLICPAAPDQISESVNVAWRAAVDASSEVLGDRLGRTVSTLDRQEIAFAIGQAVVAKLSAQPKRCWTGTLDADCWVCGRGHHEHRGVQLLCPALNPQPT